MNSKLIEGGLIVAILVVMGSAFAQTWTQTSAPKNGGPYALAESADGIKIMAGSSTLHPVVSTNYGADWSVTASNQWINRLACSADGTKVLGTFYSVLPAAYISADSGNTWNSTAIINSNTCNAVAMSADGNKLFAAMTSTAIGGLIYVSTNFGTNWTASGAPTKKWNSLAVSTDGMKVAAASDKIYLSTNAGATWAPAVTPNGTWASVACTADGMRLIASSGSGTYISTNSGLDWVLVNTLSGQVLSSADGKRLVIGGTFVYTSSDFGITWVSNSVPSVPADSVAYCSITTSADGCRLFAFRYNFSYYPFSIWTCQFVPTPNLIAGKTTPSEVRLSWPVPSTNFALQQSSDMGATNWITLTNIPVLNLTNLHQEVSLPAPNGAGFYRLIAQ